MAGQRAAEDDSRVHVRPTRADDLEALIRLSVGVYPGDRWRRSQLESHLEVFPEGQLVAVDSASGHIVGMAASLILSWDDYDRDEAWRDYTAGGTFRNHDPTGHTLYGAEVMVAPEARRMGVGSALYGARRQLVRDLGLWRIRAHSRLGGYHRHAGEMDAREYVRRVVRGELRDPALSFQLSWGFSVLAVVSGYLRRDPDSLGYAALIEWINEEAAPPEATAGLPEDFQRS